MGASTPVIKLNNDIRCPIIGLDVSQIRIEETLNQITLKDIIYQSIVKGIRLIVAEPANEIIVGEAINQALNEHKVERNDLFIVTKLEFEEKENPQKALRDSLERLNLKSNYVDLYLDHWPSCINYNKPDKYRLIPVRETWEKMESLVNQKLTRSIGVSNYNIVNMLNIISKCKIKPVVCEVEFHPYLFQKDLKQFCDLENIQIFAYNPLTKGEYPKKINLQKKCEGYLEAPLNFLAQKYNLTRTKLIINWHMALKIIPILGIKIKKPENKENQMDIVNNAIKENLEFEKIEFDQKYIDLLCSFTENQFRLNDGFDIFGINIFA